MKVISLINKSLEQKSSHFKRKRSYFYISEAGKTAQELYKSLTESKKLSPRKRRIFDNGRMVHDRLTRYLRKQGVVRSQEVEIKTKLFHGRADAIVYLNGDIAVLEIKSMRKADFDRLERFCPRQAYLQIQLYMHFLKMNEGVVLIECKDDQRLKEFQVRRKERVANETIKHFSRLKERFVKAGVMSA